MWRELKQRLAENPSGARKAALATVLLGLFLLWSWIGSSFVRWSFDLITVLTPKAATPADILLIKQDEASLSELHQPLGYFSRTNHANLLNKLTAGAAQLVVFDIYFPKSEPRPLEDEAFIEAIKSNGRVVLASEYSQLPGFPARYASPPLEEFLKVAANWGISQVEMGPDSVVRTHAEELPGRASLAWVAATIIDPGISKRPGVEHSTKWLGYYGNEGTLPSKPYYVALSMPPEAFKDKIIFVGGKPSTQPLAAQADAFATPFTRCGGPLMSGMEIQATAFLNLLHNEWLKRFPWWVEVLVILFSGAGLGYGLTLVRPVAGLVIVAGVFVVLAVVAAVIFCYGRAWFPWLLVAGAQAPCAWLIAAALRFRKLEHEEAGPAAKRGTILISPEDLVAPRLEAAPILKAGPAGTRLPPAIADHTLLRRIGKGAYGEVYLARNAINLYHAVKVIYREDFQHDEPYEREFRGIQKYMPISLKHPGLVPLLQVGRNDESRYFYYVMELGDDQSGKAIIDPATYSPHNFSEELRQRGHLPVIECLKILLVLTDTLEFLHGQRLVHRDIKPSNIIFAQGIPKFADIGLVTDIAVTGQDVSYVGTEGYIPPEGPGTPAADIFSLGVVAYQAATGLDRRRFPELPDTLTGRPDIGALLKLNRIILKACQPDANQRYQSAAEMHANLMALREEIVPKV